MKRLRITVEGKTYDVTVEVLDEAPASPPTLSAPALTSAHPAAGGPHGAETTSVISQLAGTVVSIQARVGEAVVAGAPLLVIEAMKMNTTVTAPRAGTVAAIAVEAGAVIEEGQVLATLA